MTEAIALISGANSLEFRVSEAPTASYGVIIDYPAPTFITRAEFSQTLTGTSTARGTRYEPLLQWDVSLAMTRDQWDILRGFELRQERARLGYTAMELTLIDQIHRYVEPAPQSRAKVTGATITTLPTGDLAYFAQYKCVITDLVLEGVDRWARVALSLLETSRIPA